MEPVTDPATRCFDATVGNILAPVGCFHAFCDFNRFRHFPKRARQRLPIVLLETEREEECRLAAIIRMRRVEQIFRYLLRLYDRRTGIGQFHVQTSFAIVMAADLTTNPPNATNPFLRDLPPRIPPFKKNSK